MRITIKKLQEFKALAGAHRKALYKRFVEAHDMINNQNTSEIKVIAEYNFWGGYEYAFMKIEQYRRLSPPDENNPLNKLNKDI